MEAAIYMTPVLPVKSYLQVEGYKAE